MGKPAGFRFVCFLLLAAGVALLSGCGDGIVGTSHSSYGNGISMTTTIKEDGTYRQMFKDMTGKMLTNSGKWEQAQPMGIPGVPNDGSYIQMTDYADVSRFKEGRLPATSALLPHTMMLTPKGEFQPSQTQQSQSRSTTLFWAAAFQLVFFVFWVAEIVDVARREFFSPGAKVGWVLVVVLLGCLGALIYYFFGKSQGELPAQNG